MQAVILAAGEGTRMRPLTLNRPKAMLPVANKPILEGVVLEAQKAGITDFIIVAGYQAEKIKEYFGNGDKWGVRILYRLQEPARGTADALKAAQNIVRGNFLVLNGDIIINEHDIRKLSQSNQITIGVKEVSDPSGLGVIEEKDGLVRHIFEKPAHPSSKLVNTGIYFMTQQIFSAIGNTAESERGEFELTRSIEMLIEQGVPVRCETVEQWQDIAYPWDLLEANASVMSGMSACNNGTIEENVHLKGPITIGEGTIIRSGSYLVGPVCIGRDCDIGPNCFIRPSTSIADNCRIGAGVEIKNSIIMRGTKIPHLSYIGDSIIGENCNLGAGTSIANLRLNKASIHINGQDTKHNKLGAILGDGVMTGINVSINAGTVIGNNVWIGPGMLATGIIADNIHRKS
ncbi:MAG: glucose-1-phosphate thymidylyltransferase [Dehalococcoidia bacterium]|nr:MAG: glucose-1-phosphate thymidylyltransferase [Dehalococcoidia bacterium]